MARSRDKLNIVSFGSRGNIHLSTDVYFRKERESLQIPCVTALFFQRSDARFLKSR